MATDYQSEAARVIQKHREALQASQQQATIELQAQAAQAQVKQQQQAIADQVARAKILAKHQQNAQSTRLGLQGDVADLQQRAQEERQAAQQEGGGESPSLPFTNINTSNPQAGVQQNPFNSFSGPQTTQSAGGPQPGPPQQAQGQGQGGGGVMAGMSAPAMLLSASNRVSTQPYQLGGMTLPYQTTQSTLTAEPNVLHMKDVLMARLAQQHYANTEQSQRQSDAKAIFLNLSNEYSDPRLALGVAKAVASGDDKMAMDMLGMAGETATHHKTMFDIYARGQDLAIHRATAQSTIDKNNLEMMDKLLLPKAQALAGLDPVQRDLALKENPNPRLEQLTKGLVGTQDAKVNTETAEANMKDAAKTEAGLGSLRGTLENVSDMDPTKYAGAKNWLRSAYEGAKSSLGGEDSDWYKKYSDYWYNTAQLNAKTILASFPGQRAIGIENKLLGGALPKEGVTSPARIQAINNQQKLAFDYGTVRAKLWNSEGNRIKSPSSITPEQAEDTILRAYKGYAKGSSPEDAAAKLESDYGLVRGTGMDFVDFIHTRRSRGDDAALGAGTQ